MDQKKQFSSMEDVPVIDFDEYTGKDPASPEVQNLCAQVAESLHKYGILIVRDPRAVEQDNNDYIDLMEKYFESRGNMYYKG